ncbi:hypothetical protein [Acrocarpospora sp. B8E8]|uniref:hypothetical protein n=1 Tax=Acrocarpospora sp. B8E8 TaxID=3153572 RepID=UPI00325F8F2A
MSAEVCLAPFGKGPERGSLVGIGEALGSPMSLNSIARIAESWALMRNSPACMMGVWLAPSSRETSTKSVAALLISVPGGRVT